MGHSIKVFAKRELDLNNTISNCCPEKAFLKALQKYKGQECDYYFEYDSQHVADRQIDIGYIFAAHEIFSSEPIEPIEASPINEDEVIRTLNELDKSLVYIARTGYQGGAGHFHTYFYDNNNRSWMLDGGLVGPQPLQKDDVWEMDALHDCNFISQRVACRQLTFYPIKNDKIFLNFLFSCIKDARMSKDDNLEKFKELWETIDIIEIPFINANNKIEIDESKIPKDYLHQQRAEQQRRNVFISLAEEKINNILNGLPQKIGGIAQHPLKEAKQTAENLLHALHGAKLTYLNSLNNLDINIKNTNEIFKNDCNRLIEKAKPILERDIGWGTYLTNLLKTIANTIIAVSSFGQVNSFFKKERSQSIQIVEEVEHKLNP